MSCSSLRSFHNLCVVNCSTNACPCAPNAAFSCRPLCPCPELQDNQIFTQARVEQLMCGEVGSRQVFTDIIFQTTFQFMEFIGLTGWPIFSCPVELFLRVLDSDVQFLAATIIGGVAIPTNLTLPANVYNILINQRMCSGNIEFDSISNLIPEFCNVVASCISLPITSTDFLTCLTNNINWPVVLNPVNIILDNNIAPVTIGTVTNGLFSSFGGIIPTSIYVILIDDGSMFHLCNNIQVDIAAPPPPIPP